MLIATGDRLDDALVQVLGYQGPKNANWLHATIRQRFRKCSVQGVYHELRKLQRTGVIVKIKDQYHLSLTWATQLSTFSNSVAQKFIAGANSASILPGPGTTMRWHLTDLLRADDLWVQIYEKMFIETASPHVFSWAAYPWYYFAQPKKVLEYYRFVQRENKKLYYILGSDNFLARKYIETVPAKILEYSFAPPQFETQESVCLSTMGPYFFTFSIDTNSLKVIRKVFLGVKRSQDINYAMISSIFQSSARISIKVENNLRKAKKLQRKFGEYFGIKVDKVLE